MRNAFTALTLAILWPCFTSAQTTKVLDQPALGTSEKVMLAIFIVSAIIVFFVGKFAYDMIFRKKH